MMINGFRVSVFAALFAVAVNTHAQNAEFAVRWSPQAGGPVDGEKVSKLLGIQRKASAYIVRYFEVSVPADAPSGVGTIVRERVRSAKTEVTWKYRGTAGFPAGGPTTWRCPLIDETKRKDEVDTSFLADGSVRRAFSRSCTSQGALQKVLPAAFNPHQKGCSSKMKRRESAEEMLTVEEWRLSNGEVVLEVSMKGHDSAQDLEKFKQIVVNKLLSAGVTPLDRSKTEIGTQCN